ncbi:hypothetical protein ACFL2V_19620 [Pseudomonadota bacterium]
MLHYLLFVPVLAGRINLAVEAVVVVATGIKPEAVAHQVATANPNVHLTHLALALHHPPVVLAQIGPINLAVEVVVLVTKCTKPEVVTQGVVAANLSVPPALLALHPR